MTPRRWRRARRLWLLWTVAFMPLTIISLQPEGRTSPRNNTVNDIAQTFWLTMFCVAVSLVLLLLAYLWARFTNEPAPPPANTDAPDLCPHCDYDLRGLASSRCPECGTPRSRPLQSGAQP